MCLSSLAKQWSHHQKAQGNDKHDYRAAKQISGRFVSLFISRHGTLDEHSKTKAGLITTLWHIREISTVQNRINIYLYHEHLCRLSWGKKYWTCLQVSDNMFLFWEHISILLLRLPFLQVCYGDFDIFQLSGQRCLWSASYRMNKDAPPNTIGKLGPEGMD